MSHSCMLNGVPHSMTLIICDNLFYHVFGFCCFHFYRMFSHPLQIQAASHTDTGLSHMHAATGCRSSDKDFTYKSEVQVLTVEVLPWSPLPQKIMACSAASWQLGTQRPWRALFKFNHSWKRIQPFIKLLFPSCFMLLSFFFFFYAKVLSVVTSALSVRHCLHMCWEQQCFRGSYNITCTGLRILCILLPSFPLRWTKHILTGQS